MAESRPDVIQNVLNRGCTMRNLQPNEVKGIVCPLCGEDLYEIPEKDRQKLVVSTKCRHHIHRDCLEDWVDDFQSITLSECPVCSEELFKMSDALKELSQMRKDIEQALEAGTYQGEERKAKEQLLKVIKENRTYGYIHMKNLQKIGKG